MRRILTAGVLTAITIVPASAGVAQGAGQKKKDRPTICERAYGVRVAVIKRHGKRAPGRNICRFGVVSKFNPKWSKEATTKQRARYLRQLKRLLAPPRYAQLTIRAGGPPQKPGGTLTAKYRVANGSHLARIAACESGGNPRAISPGGQYRGKYQFSVSTWRSVGGRGDPAAASEAEQDRLAAKLYATAGPGQWPVCSR